MGGRGARRGIASDRREMLARARRRRHDSRARCSGPSRDSGIDGDQKYAQDVHAPQPHDSSANSERVRTSTALDVTPDEESIAQR